MILCDIGDHTCKLVPMFRARKGGKYTSTHCNYSKWALISAGWFKVGGAWKVFRGVQISQGVPEKLFKKGLRGEGVRLMRPRCEMGSYPLPIFIDEGNSTYFVSWVTLIVPLTVILLQRDRSSYQHTFWINTQGVQLQLSWHPVTEHNGGFLLINQPLTLTTWPVFSIGDPRNSL